MIRTLIDRFPGMILVAAVGLLCVINATIAPGRHVDAQAESMPVSRDTTRQIFDYEGHVLSTPDTLPDALNILAQTRQNLETAHRMNQQAIVWVLRFEQERLAAEREAMLKAVEAEQGEDGDVNPND